MSRSFPSSMTLDHLRREAKRWRKALLDGDAGARERFERVLPNHPRTPVLRDVQHALAREYGFGGWNDIKLAVQLAVIDVKGNSARPRRRLAPTDWDAMIGLLKERRITALVAAAGMTDDALARIAELHFVTSLDLGGSPELTDDGLLHLARMPQLERLVLNDRPGGPITDRGLEVLRHLPNLRTFAMAWQSGVTDRGVANLRWCDLLEDVDLMGSPTGDGAIEALRGKAHLRRLGTGRLVTDAGIALLRDVPLLTTAGADARLLVDGPFTDVGLAAIAQLEGVVDLDLFWHVDRITSDGFAYLAAMPNLMALGCDGTLSDDVAMRHIASMPRLRRLRAQESVATDAGFVALSGSQTIESIWGRVCPNFGSRGFLALSTMPSLRTLGIGCKNVDDAALSRLPAFPALRELTPIDVGDDGFRHVGRVRTLERLLCMYCRDTGDAATEHIRGLALTYYYAGMTQITDRSLEMLGTMESLERIDFYRTEKITNAGLSFLTRLPKLREVHIDGSGGVTLEGTAVFPPGVDVHYST